MGPTWPSICIMIQIIHKTCKRGTGFWQLKLFQCFTLEELFIVSKDNLLAYILSNMLRQQTIATSGLCLYGLWTKFVCCCCCFRSWLKRRRTCNKEPVWFAKPRIFTNLTLSRKSLPTWVTIMDPNNQWYARTVNHHDKMREPKGTKTLEILL